MTPQAAPAQDWQGMSALIEAQDWAATAFGPRTGWPENLESCLSLCMGARFPLAVWWGSGLVQLYNDAFRRAIGEDRHLSGFVVPLADGWPDLWPLLSPSTEAILAGTRKGALLEALPFFTQTPDMQSPGLFSLSLSAVHNGTGEVTGILAAFHEAMPWGEVDGRRGLLLALGQALEAGSAHAERTQGCCALLGAYFGMQDLELIEVGEGDACAWPARKAESNAISLERLGSAALLALHAGTPAPLGAGGGQVAGLALPIRGEGGKLSAVLAARRLRHWEPHEIEVLTEAFDHAMRGLSAARLAQEQAHEAQSLRQMVRGEPALLWHSARKGRWLWSSPQWEELTGLTEAESRGEGWLAAVHTEDRDGLRKAWEEALLRGRFTGQARLRSAKDGSFRWFLMEGRPTEGEWFGLCMDVDTLQRSHRNQQEALEEMWARSHATFALIRSLARRSAETAASAADLAMALDGRIEAVARAQAIATRDPEGWVALDYLVAEELGAHGAHESGSIRIEGPALLLRLTAAQTIGLAIHELVSLALAQGALDGEGGSIGISWRLEEEAGPQRLSFFWDEHLKAAPSSDPQLVEERRQAFTLLEKILTLVVHARTHVEQEENGFRCSIVLPLDPGAVAHPPPADEE